MHPPGSATASLCLMKIVVRAFPTALRYGTAGTIILFFSASYFPGVGGCVLAQQQWEGLRTSLTSTICWHWFGHNRWFCYAGIIGLNYKGVR